MQLNETTKADILYVADHTVSRGCLRDLPDKEDYIYTLRHEDKILGVGGVKMINKTTGWAWIDATDNAWMTFPETRQALKVIREYMQIIVDLAGLHRLQAFVEMDFKVAIRTIEHLGFKREGIMKEFVSNKDVYLYVKFFGKTDNDI